MKYTPGPWTVDVASFYRSGHEGDGRMLVRDATGFGIAQANAKDESGEASEETGANARLIAAAPELFEIAKAYRNLLKTMAHTDGEVATFEHIQGVLAKTEGTRK